MLEEKKCFLDVQRILMFLNGACLINYAKEQGKSGWIEKKIKILILILFGLIHRKRNFEFRISDQLSTDVMEGKHPDSNIPKNVCTI